MTRAIVLRETGGPEKLLWESVDVPDVSPGTLRIRHTAIGVNFHDTYVRTGLYKTLPLPGIMGVDAVGVVEDIADDVTGFSRGDRVYYIAENYGGYAEARILPARLALRVPDSISDDRAASLILKGFTACMLLRYVRHIEPGQCLLIHAAAGAVGQPLVRWAKHLGARVLATVGSEDKAIIARRCGADEIIFYRRENVVERVMEMTGGRGVDVVYDSVGADTFFASLDSLAYTGALINFGQSSGAVPPFSVSLLARRSTSVARPIAFHYFRDRKGLEAFATQTFAVIESGVIDTEVSLKLPLEQARDAHVALESRATSGAVILVPGLSP